jgi:hypothetical protein
VSDTAHVDGTDASGPADPAPAVSVTELAGYSHSMVPGGLLVMS